MVFDTRAFAEALLSIPVVSLFSLFVPYAPNPLSPKQSKVESRFEDESHEDGEGEWTLNPIPETLHPQP